ncbi:MAG: ribose-5-phosphate isomerase RpiA [Neisseriaceae bacterium]|nr:MAG: ribose-5-phosphate isomerase RpiA [Neisseriaceae bacterium]
MLTQDDKKRMAAKEALRFLPKDGYIGIGTGSTVNFFIEELAAFKEDIRGVVSTSEQTKTLLLKHGFNILDLNEVTALSVYFDGADEVNSLLQMVKGGGGALLAEKVVASVANNFVCMVDDSKYVPKLGAFAVPVEVLSYARSMVSRKMVALGGRPELRMNYTTEQGNQIIDVHSLNLSTPMELENEINQIPGVVENGIFAKHPANVLVIGRDGGTEVKQLGGFF